MFMYVSSVGKDSNDFFKSEASAVAINFFDFWLDTNDYAELPKSAFQSYRACFLYEKYLMHGASRNVPITTNVTDECSQTLFGKNLDHLLNVDLVLCFMAFT